MSDAVLVALITVSGVLLTPIIAHILGRRDRALASDVVAAKDRELDALKASHAAELAQRDSTIAWLRSQIDTRGVATW